jgi:hypothetical protein
MQQTADASAPMGALHTVTNSFLQDSSEARIWLILLNYNLPAATQKLWQRGVCFLLRSFLVQVIEGHVLNKCIRL